MRAGLVDCINRTCSGYDSLSTAILRANQRAARLRNHRYIPLIVILCLSIAPTYGHAEQAVSSVPPPYAPPIAATAVPAVPPSYVIGAEDVLQVMFWRDADMSGEVIVRPDGKISLPLLNDVQAAGLTPEQLRARITEMARNYVDTPNATVVVKAINSRKVFVMGAIEKPGTYPIAGGMTVLQLIATAGGLKEFANGDEIRIIRRVDGTDVRLEFNYGRVLSGKNLKQNIELKPNDTVVVP
jgi:polysaccharide export outer membrane protein